MTEPAATLGTTDVVVPRMGVGVMTWGDPSGRARWTPAKLAYGGGPANRDEEQRAFDAGVAAGATLFDTAEMYGAGASERRLGELAHGRDVLIATKFPPNMLSRADAMPRALERSLELLQRSTLDLYMHHYPSRRVSIPRLMNLMADAVEQGKVRAVGVSNYSADQMRLAHRVLADRGVPLASNQIEYSLLHRQPETDGVIDACRELGVTLIANQPLANGALTGKFVAGARPSGFRRFMPRFRGKEREAVTPGRRPAPRDRRRTRPEPGPGRAPLAHRERTRPAHPGRQERPPGGRQRRRPRLLAHPGRDRDPRSGHHRLAPHERNHSVKFGLQIYSFTWPGGPEAIGPTLGRAVRTADDAGFDSIWVMDHFWQIGGPGSELQPMLEGWTTLGFMAAHSQRARLGLMVGGVHYRNPGLWVKAATTLDVLSGGRAWLGIGAAWNQAESEGLGFPLPAPHRALRDARGHAPDRARDVAGRARLGRGVPRPPVPRDAAPQRPPVDLPAARADHDRRRRREEDPATRRPVRRRLEPVRRPSPAGSRSTQILAEHCAAVGRDFAEIERTNMQGVGLGSAGAWSRTPESPDAIVERFGRLAEAGVQHVIVNFADANDPALIELLGSRVLPQLRDVEAADPRQVATAGGRA